MASGVGLTAKIQSSPSSTHAPAKSEKPFPSRSAAAKKVGEILSFADICINGSRPWDIQVRDERLYQRLIAEGSIGAGESYMDGWWDVEQLDEFFTRIHGSAAYNKVGKWSLLWLALKGRIFNRQTKSRSVEVTQKHYDFGNDLYEAMLDPKMQYTCGYWPGATTLDEAQDAKLHLICRKIGLARGMNVLELGGGFGGLARFMAQEYDCRVVSYNISREQIKYGRESCKGLPVRFEEKDYREAIREKEPFDRVVSIGLCEHIGYKNYRRFMELAHSQLKKEGLFLLHTIGGNRSYTCTDAWIDKYIFPNGVIPSAAQLGKAFEGLWVIEDWHNFGPDYDKTLMAWWENFQRSWPRLQSSYGDRFYRMWKLYLHCSAGGFRSRTLQLWQIVLSKGDIPSYTPVR